MIAAVNRRLWRYEIDDATSVRVELTWHYDERDHTGRREATLKGVEIQYLMVDLRNLYTLTFHNPLCKANVPKLSQRQVEELEGAVRMAIENDDELFMELASS